MAIQCQQHQIVLRPARVSKVITIELVVQRCLLLTLLYSIFECLCPERFVFVIFLIFRMRFNFEFLVGRVPTLNFCKFSNRYQYILKTYLFLITILENLDNLLTSQNKQNRFSSLIFAFDFHKIFRHPKEL